MAHSPYDISLAGTVLKNIQSINHSTNSNPVPGYPSGEAGPGSIFDADCPHSTTFQSTDLQTILGLNTATYISSGVFVSGGSTLVPIRKRLAGGIHASGSTHEALSCQNTLVFPTGVNAVQGQSAAIDSTMRYQSTDGMVNPVSQLGSQTLAASAMNSEYVLHSASVAGVAVSALVSVTITPGITITDGRSGGGPYPTALFITQVAPLLDIVTENTTAAHALLAGDSLGVAGVDIYLAQRSSSGVITATGSSAHVKISAAAGMRQLVSSGGDSRGSLQCTVRVNCLALTAATSVAIP